MSKASSAEDLQRLLEPVVARAGLDLESIEVTPAGKRRVLRVVVDQDGGVSLDDIAAISQTVSSLLDDSEAMGQVPFVLEVTSPGVDRPLTQLRHWRRASGRLVKARLTAGGEVLGRVRTADDDGLVVEIDGTTSRFAWSEVGTGLMQVEFQRPGADTGADTAGVDTAADADEEA